MIKIPSFERCVFEFGKLPGIGQKTASRLALHIMKMSPSEVENLAESLVDLRNSIKFCKKCGSITDKDICEVCVSDSRNKQIICVVEEAKDVMIIEGTGRYNGLYHVLGGKISPIDGIGPADLRIDNLIERLSEEPVNEVIIATNPNVEGETTAMYLMKKISVYPNIEVTRIASGVPIGGHLEYSDDITILKALENRRKLV
jgi:recombination protein RecR